MSKPVLKIKLKECTVLQRGSRPVLLQTTPFAECVPYLGIHALETGKVLEYTYKELGNISTEDDVLVVWDGARSGLALKGKYGVIGSTIVSLTPVGMLTDYLYYFIQSNYDFINGNLTGSGITHVDPELFLKLEVPYTSLSEQLLIVEQIKAINSQNRILLEQQRTALVQVLSMTDIKYQSSEDIDVSFAGFRKAVLQAAFSGALTKDFPREKIRDDINVIKDGFALNPNYKIPEKLPDGWIWSSLGSVAKCQRGRFAARPRNDPKYFQGEHPFIQIAEIPENGGVITDFRQTLNPLGARVSKMFKKDTVVVAIVGGSIGNSGILGQDTYFPDSIVGISVSEGFDHEYIALYLQSEKDNIRNLSYSSGGQFNLKIEFINHYPVPCPPIEEQREIVKRIKILFETYERVQSQYQSSLAYFTQLGKSVLQDAFNSVYWNSDQPQEEIRSAVRQQKEVIEEQRRLELKKSLAIRTKMKNQILARPLNGIEQVLKENNSPMSAARVWEASRFRDDIDGFYEALKMLVPDVVNWTVEYNEMGEPDTLLTLNTPINEN